MKIKNWKMLRQTSKSLEGSCRYCIPALFLLLVVNVLMANSVDQPVYIEDYVYNVLSPSHSSGSIVYSLRCGGLNKIDYFIIDFPYNPSDGTKTNLDKLVNRFPRMSWAVDAGGKISVKDTTVNSKLLNHRISSISIEDSRDPILMIMEILGSDELADVINTYHYKWRSEFEHTLMHKKVATGQNETLHFNNMTVEEVLNKILEKHPGIWSYSECNVNKVKYYHVSYDIVPVPIRAGGAELFPKN